MPIFEYQCPQCDHRTEILQKNAQAPLPACPQCNHPTMQKCLSGFAVGSGRPDKAACETCPGATGGASPCMGGQCPLG